MNQHHKEKDPVGRGTGGKQSDLARSACQNALEALTLPALIPPPSPFTTGSELVNFVPT